MRQLSQAAIRFAAMKEGFNAVPIISFAVREGYAPDVKTAEAGLDSVMQWLAGHAVDQHVDFPYVMMNGQVDQMYHALMLNTRTYLHFCRDYVGFFIHHTPVDDAVADSISLMNGVDKTLSYLKTAFDEDLAAPLQDWIESHARGELQATSVSCVSNAPDSAPEKLLGIKDFASFWDRNPHKTVGTA
jgi:hypothetical protein